MKKNKKIFKKIVFFIISLSLISFISIFLNKGIYRHTNFTLLEKTIPTDKCDIDIMNGFKKVSLNMNLDEVVCLVGKPSRIDDSEYGFKWYVYNQYKKTFFMVGIDKEKVVGIYSNTHYNNHLDDITFDKNRDYITANHSSIDYIPGRNIKVNRKNKDEYDILKKHNYYITVFYDTYDGNKISSYELIKSKYKKNIVDDFYTNDNLKNSRYYNEQLKNSFELQMYDLINSTREKHGLNKLSYDKENAHNSAKMHAYDMMVNNYFAHDNLKGETPFDRMDMCGVEYTLGGENLAGGQFSPIYAHEALMNSEGHRKNILNAYYNSIGIGIEFGGELDTYYVENFYRN